MTTELLNTTSVGLPDHKHLAYIYAIDSDIPSPAHETALWINLQSSLCESLVCPLLNDLY